MILHNIYLWILSILRDLFYLISIVYRNLMGLIRFNKPIHINELGHKNPIILVHGSGGNQSEWLYALPYINKHLWMHPTYAFTMDLEFDEKTNKQYIRDIPHDLSFGALKMKKHSHKIDNPIEHYVDKLANAVRYVHRAHNKNVILIGHSMGGLIANKLAVGDYGKYIDSVMCISSPLQGAPLLKYNIMKKILNTRRHKQMTPNSEFLECLYDSIKNNPARHNRLTFGSNQDIHVPNDYAQLPVDVRATTASVDHIDIHGYGHFSIVSAERIWKNIARWLHRNVDINKLE